VQLTKNRGQRRMPGWSVAPELLKTRKGSSSKVIGDLFKRHFNLKLTFLWRVKRPGSNWGVQYTSSLPGKEIASSIRGGGGGALYRLRKIRGNLTKRPTVNTEIMNKNTVRVKLTKAQKKKGGVQLRVRKAAVDVKTRGPAG